MTMNESKITLQDQIKQWNTRDGLASAILMNNWLAYDVNVVDPSGIPVDLHLQQLDEIVVSLGNACRGGSPAEYGFKIAPLHGGFSEYYVKKNGELVATLNKLTDSYALELQRPSGNWYVSLRHHF